MVSLSSLQQSFFARLNPIVEPLARSPWSGPHLVGPGLLLLETTGRRTGATRVRPLLSWRVGSTVFAGTVRPTSDWIANLRANPASRIWLDGEPAQVDALVLPLPVGWLAKLEERRPQAD